MEAVAVYVVLVLGLTEIDVVEVVLGDHDQIGVIGAQLSTKSGRLVLVVVTVDVEATVEAATPSAW